MQFRIDIVGLDAETKPTSGIIDGTTYYTVDSHKLFIYYKGQWYDQEAEFTPQEESGDSDEQENNQKELIKNEEIKQNELEETEEKKEINDSEVV